MPLLRYFVFVGGALVALLFLSNAVLPKPPVAEVTNTASELPMIRIHSAQKWPQRVVIDTSLPTIVPTQTATAEPDTPATTVADVPAQAGTARRLCTTDDSGVEKAGPETAPQTQGGKKADGSADSRGRATAAVQLLCQQQLVTERRRRACEAGRSRPPALGASDAKADSSRAAGVVIGAGAEQHGDRTGMRADRPNLEGRPGLFDAVPQHSGIAGWRQRIQSGPRATGTKAPAPTPRQPLQQANRNAAIFALAETLQD